MSDPAVIRGRKAWRYAQWKSGLKLHLAEMLPTGDVERYSLCGLIVDHWRMTINLPLAHACQRCQKATALR